MLYRFYLFVLLSAIAAPSLPSYACTIMSAVDSKGQVWNANNEDGPLGVGNFINVFPAQEEGQYGYYTLSYFSRANGTGGNLQGGMNEAGLTFDFNAMPTVEDFDMSGKKLFPEGDNAILPHILATMASTQEVIDFFEVYWFEHGFRGAQMHVADAQGNFAMISASGSMMVEKGLPLVSTNFDLCGGEDGASCWRFPIATELLEEREIGLETMMAVAKATAVAESYGSTLYTNVQNLSTGEVWFTSLHDAGKVVQTSIKALLSKGAQSYSFRQLDEINESQRSYVYAGDPDAYAMDKGAASIFDGEYHIPMGGRLQVKDSDTGLKVSIAGTEPIPFFPHAPNGFYFPGEDIRIRFAKDAAGRMTLEFYENGYWSFTATRQED